MGKLRTKGLWIALGLLVLISPLGLLAEGAAWAEWGAEELEGMLGFMPEGLGGLAEFWHAPAPDYSVGGMEANVGYILSGILGIVAVVATTWLLGRWLSRGGADG